MSKKSKSHFTRAVAVGRSIEIGGKIYTRKAVTLPLLMINDGDSISVRLEGPIHESTMATGRKGGDGKDMKPMKLCNVVMMADYTSIIVKGKEEQEVLHAAGEERQLVCNAVLESTLEEHFPDASYVGKCFEIGCTGKVPGKRYKGFTLAELVSE